MTEGNGSVQNPPCAIPERSGTVRNLGMERRQHLLQELFKWTPLAEVTQGMVAAFLDGPTTLLVADAHNSVVRAVSLKDFSLRTFAGQLGKFGNHDGKACEALFNDPYAMAVHEPTDSVLVGEWNGCCVRVHASGETRTLCGKPGEQGYQEGASTNARFKSISGAVVVGEDLVVSDYGNECLRRVPLDGSSSSLFAGQPGQRGFTDSPNAQFSSPRGLTADCDGNVFVAEGSTHAIRMVTPTGKVTTLAGCGERGYVDGVGREARFNYPSDCIWDGKDCVLVSDFQNHCVRRVHIKTGQVSTLAGEPTLSSRKAIPFPLGVAINRNTGDIFVSSVNNELRRISPQGDVTIIVEGNLSFPHGMVLI